MHWKNYLKMGWNFVYVVAVTITISFLFLSFRSTINAVQLSSEVQLPSAESNNFPKVQQILDLLKEGEKVVDQGPHKDVIIVMGNTGAGKSTVTQFITGNNEGLTSVERIKNSGEFIIQDESGKVSTKTWTSMTIFPELMEDKETNVKFYDCAGFSDTRGVAHDITATYFTKEVVKNIERIKLMFVVSYHSVRVGGDRQDFMMFAQHVAKAIKHIDKFNDSIVLIVTKVDNSYRAGGILVSDETIVELIVDFLRKLRSEVEEKISPFGNSLTNESYAEIVKFIDILLKQDRNYYPRIAIFRRPNESGPISQIKSLQDNKKSLEQVVHKNTIYTKHEEDDFDYTISASSKNSIYDLVEVMKVNIASDVVSSLKEIQKLFNAREENTTDVEELHTQFQLAVELFSAIKENVTELGDFVSSVSEIMKELNLTTTNEKLLGLTKYTRYLEFLKPFGARDIKSSEWSQDLPLFIQYLEKSQNWYNFLTEFDVALSEYEVQRNLMDSLRFADSFVALMEAPEYHSKESRETIEEWFQRFGRGLMIAYDRVKNLNRLSSVKLTKLKLVIDLALKSTSWSCDKSYIFKVDGRFVKLSDLTSLLRESCEGAKFIEIIAEKKLFIDADLDLTGQEADVAMIAQTWEVINRHKIVLDGSEGKTEDCSHGGCLHGVAGGDPGVPGNPAGNFMGLGEKFINGSNLHISANGGRGGAGQNGKAGLAGKDGSTPDDWRSNLDWPENHLCAEVSHEGRQAARAAAATLGTVALGFALFNPFTAVPAALVLLSGAAVSSPGEEQECVVYGEPCGDGSAGGDGGVGGIGGKQGQIEVISLGNEPMITKSSVEGGRGRPGYGGKGGHAGRSGRVVKFLATKNQHSWHLEKVSSSDRQHCNAGKTGLSGRNSQGLREPKENIRSQHIYEFVQSFLTENHDKSWLRKNSSEKDLQ